MLVDEDDPSRAVQAERHSEGRRPGLQPDRFPTSGGGDAAWKRSGYEVLDVLVRSLVVLKLNSRRRVAVVDPNLSGEFPACFRPIGAKPQV